MIDHNTRPLEKKRDWWQLEIPAFKRRLDEHQPEYVPKKHREYPKSRKKWAKTYYPSVPRSAAIDPFDFPEVKEPGENSRQSSS